LLAIAPDHRMLRIVDPDGPDTALVPIDSSGSILQYPAHKTGRFYGTTKRDRTAVDQWRTLQIAAMGAELEPAGTDTGGEAAFRPLAG
jgi:GSH-dependent disulfide-bond oxidoreductase